ncbi:putative cytochrome P450 [Streptomyces sp. NBRC 110611]|uniref:cytochrome P450 n=1 Tax=Streptomyces sp. NBRC 110611 TaxID=1621259 RepID=UPI0008295E4C|nr:cytochrome P450 [Streptomyces sp. NBRC 110611]GAU65883.1 putative cytochrome P450 [Streptomyces sp. NBRC 110611]
MPDVDVITFPQKRTCPYQPPEGYQRLWEQRPLARVVLYNGRVVWAVTGEAEARRLLRDARLSSDNTHPRFPSLAARFADLEGMTLPLLTVDDPEHRRQRQRLIPHFGVRRIAALRETVQRVVDRHLDAMVRHGSPADLVSAFALPVSSTVVCQLLGVPYADHDFFEERTRWLMRGATARQTRDGYVELRAYLEALVYRKESRSTSWKGTGTAEGVVHGDHGLLDELVEGRGRSGGPDRDELVALALVLLIAGHETTAHSIATGVLMLLEHPRQLAALRADESLFPSAVEELLRYLSTLDGLVRVAVEDVETGGTVIRAGEGVVFPTSVLNRDPAVHPRPDEVDVRRADRRHLAFGFGVHQCLGQHLARLELEIALRTLLARLPGLRLAVPAGSLACTPGDASFQGVTALPVTW